MARSDTGLLVLACGQAPALTATEFGIPEIVMRPFPHGVDRRSIGCRLTPDLRPA